MIGVFEQRDQLLALEKRRQEIAARNAAGPASPAVTAPVAVPLAASVMPAGGHGTPATALKAAEPDVAKRRRKGKAKDREPVATAASDVGDGMRAQWESEARADDAGAAKATNVRGFTEGPGTGAEPVRPPGAESYDREYLSAGRGAPSPQMEPPRTNPVPAPYGQGVPVPIELPGAPAAARVPVHVTESLCLGSPSDR